MTHKCTLALAISIALTGTGHVAAQEIEENRQLEEVTVTATRRETTIMDAPVSVQAFSGEKIEQANLTDLADLATSVPNMNLGTEAQVSNPIFIRGIGSGTDRGLEQSVALYVDGVYQPRSRQINAAFFDMERVEVMRGPQAVLFGLNATAGTLSITSRRTLPGEEFNLELMADYEFEYGGTRFGAIASGSLGDSLGYRVAARTTDTGDGYYINHYSGEDENTTKEDIFRATFVWEPTDKLDVDFKIEYMESEMDGIQGEAFGVPSSPVLESGLNWERNTETDFIDIVAPGESFGFDMESLNAMLNFDYQIGDGTLTALFGYTDFEYQHRVEVVGWAMPLFVGNNNETFDHKSAEFRYTSPMGNKVDYIVGLYASNSDMTNDFPTAFGPLLVAPSTALAQNIYNTQENDVVSPFASVTFNISDTFRLIAGARYSWEDKTASRDTSDRLLTQGCGLYVDPDGDNRDWQFLFNPAPPCPGVTFIPDEFDRDSSNFMPELIAQWDLGMDTRIYAKAGSSAKSGGFATSGSAPTRESIEFDDETATTLEAGYRTRFADGRARFNATLFYTMFDDVQVQTFQLDGANVLSLIDNAGESTSYGAEFELDYLLTDWLIVGGSLGLLNAEWDKFTSAPCDFEAKNTGNYDGDIPGTCNFNGKSTQFAPDYSGALYADVNLPLTSTLSLTGGVNMGFSDDYFTESTLDPVAVQDAYTRWDANIGIAKNDGKWSLSLVGKNLSNEKILSNTVPVYPFSYVGYIHMPRTVTLQGRFNF